MPPTTARSVASTTAATTASVGGAVEAEAEVDNAAAASTTQRVAPATVSATAVSTGMARADVATGSPSERKTPQDGGCGCGGGDGGGVSVAARCGAQNWRNRARPAAAAVDATGGRAGDAGCRLRRQHDPRHADRPSARLAVSALVALPVEVLRAARASRSARGGHDWRRATAVHEAGGGAPPVARVDGACRGVLSRLLTAAGLRSAAAAGAVGPPTKQQRRWCSGIPALLDGGEGVHGPRRGCGVMSVSGPPQGDSAP